MFFPIKNLELLIIYMDCQEFKANLDCSFMSSLITSSNLITFVSLYYIVTFNISFSLTRSLLVPHAYVSIKSVDCILSLSFEHKAILIPSVETFCLSILNLCCVFNIDLFLINCMIIFSIMSIYLFLDGLFYFQVELLLNSFYNF